MTSRILALAFVLALPVFVGCDPAAKLHGKWDLDTEEPEPPGGSTGMGTYIPPALLSFMKLKMNLEFKYDGKFIAEAKAGGETATARGNWKYVKTEGDTAVVMIELNGKEEQEVRIRFLDGNQIEMTVPPVDPDDTWGQQTATFSRRPF